MAPAHAAFEVGATLVRRFWIPSIESRLSSLFAALGTRASPRAVLEAPTPPLRPSYIVDANAAVQRRVERRRREASAMTAISATYRPTTADFSVGPNVSSLGKLLRACFSVSPHTSPRPGCATLPAPGGDRSETIWRCVHRCRSVVWTAKNFVPKFRGVARVQSRTIF
jgi:hypothetical protein